MTTIMLSIIAATCLIGFSSFSFADEMGKIKDEMEGEMKGHQDEMKGEMMGKMDAMKGEEDEMKGKMGEMGK
jgi:hypothetical protein